MEHSALVNSVARPWIRSRFFDTALLAFCWVPVYVWVVFGLGIGAEPFGYAPLSTLESQRALSLAILVVLGLTSIHRHYTFVLVYGDGPTFRERAVAYIAAPIVVFGLAALALGHDRPVAIAGFEIHPFTAMLIASGLWNVWHTVQQRYGILRAYAGKARGGLKTRAHSRRDRLLLWTAVLALAVLLPWSRASTFESHPNALRVLRNLEPIVDHPAYVAAVVAALAALVIVARQWWQFEREAEVDRGPRWLFLGSTIALLVVFVVHGPIVGYLCFGAAHALEYLAFVHHFAERRFEGEHRSVAATFLGRPIVFAPILIAGLGLLYLAMRERQGTNVYLAYYVGTSMLHFLYDGWIWKLRQPKVSAPLMR